MITDKQKKLFKRVIIYSDLVVYEMLGLLAVAILLLLLFMIDELALNNPGFFESGIYILMIVLVIYCPLMLVHGIYARQATVKRDWLDMEEKAKELLPDTEEDDKTDYGSTVTKTVTALVSLAATKSAVKTARIAALPAFYNEMKAMAKHDDAMADLFGVKIRFRKATKLALVLPIVALLVAFGIRCIDAAQIKESASTAAGSAIDALVDSFSDGCARTYSDDPYEEYDANGYHTSCYLDNSGDIYVSVDIDNSGLITEVYYHIVVDEDESKEDNLIMVEELLSEMYSLVINSGVEADGNQLEEPTLTDTFKESFLASEDYESISEETDTVWLLFSANNEEDYNYFGHSYFSVTIEG